jgi:hypothetical protein
MANGNPGLYGARSLVGSRFVQEIFGMADGDTRIVSFQVNSVAAWVARIFLFLVGNRAGKRRANG